MDVFVIPFGDQRYELYFEHSHETEVETEMPSTGFFGRLKQRFQYMLRAAEERQRRGDKPEEPQGWWAWAQERMMAWVAERIAEQRLLWNLRRQTAVMLSHPPDLTFEQALAIAKQILKADYDRHLRWLIIDGILFILSGVFFFVPGPNVIAYYFAFRLVGHWLSMRGASQGMHRVEWTGRPCPPLNDLLDVPKMEARTRSQRVTEVGERLRLPHLARFYERLAVRHP